MEWQARARGRLADLEDLAGASKERWKQAAISLDIDLSRGIDIGELRGEVLATLIDRMDRSEIEEAARRLNVASSRNALKRALTPDVLQSFVSVTPDVLQSSASTGGQFAPERTLQETSQENGNSAIPDITDVVVLKRSTFETLLNSLEALFAEQLVILLEKLDALPLGIQKTQLNKSELVEALRKKFSSAPDNSPDSQESALPTKAEASFIRGSQVIIQGLSMQHYNGMKGTCKELNVDQTRWVVELRGGETKSFKTDNLVLDEGLADSQCIDSLAVTSEFPISQTPTTSKSWEEAGYEGVGAWTCVKCDEPNNATRANCNLCDAPNHISAQPSKRDINLEIRNDSAGVGVEVEIGDLVLALKRDKQGIVVARDDDTWSCTVRFEDGSEVGVCYTDIMKLGRKNPQASNQQAKNFDDVCLVCQCDVGAGHIKKLICQNRCNVWLHVKCYRELLGQPGATCPTCRTPLPGARPSASSYEDFEAHGLDPDDICPYGAWPHLINGPCPHMPDGPPPLPESLRFHEQCPWGPQPHHPPCRHYQYQTRNGYSRIPQRPRRTGSQRGYPMDFHQTLRTYLGPGFNVRVFF